jgi:Kef-type K+ transport system membrane component KefB/nucleotide-binding universal stress UspA family protein
MQIISSAPHNDVLALLVQIAVLLLTARLFGEIANRIGQPAVIGEILAGVFWGPSIMGKFFPVLSGLVIPGNLIQGYLLETVSMIGAVFLLLITGFETDLSFIKRNGKLAIIVSLGGIILPFVSGFFLGQYLPDTILVNPDKRLEFSLFIATAMSISAIPVIAKVLIDMKLLKRNIGQIVIAAGMVDDAVGWTLLSVVLSMLSEGSVSFASTSLAILKVLLFIALSAVVGYQIVKHSLNLVQDKLKDENRILTLVIVLTFIWGALSQALKLEAIFGAFAIGIIFSRMQRLPHHVVEKIKSFALGVFAPIFFAVAGLKMNLLEVFDKQYIPIALIVIFVACFGKIVGVYINARLFAKQDHWTALSFGAALNARGGMEIIIATIGLKVGILSVEMFSIIVFMAIVTSLMAPIILRFSLSHIKIDNAELKRLDQEKLALASPIKNIHRVLLPIKFNKSLTQAFLNNQSIKFTLLEKIIRKNRLSITLLSIYDGLNEKSDKDNAKQLLDSLTERFKGQELFKKITESHNIASAILDEAQKDYDLILVGTNQDYQNDDNLFSKIIDTTVRLSPGTTVVIHNKGDDPNWSPSKILVPSNGSLAARYAAEFAFLLAAPTDTVYLLNIIEQDKDWESFIHADSVERQAKIATKIIDHLLELSELYDVAAMRLARIGKDTYSEIIAAALEENVDLIVLGTNVRPASDRLFLGPHVEKIIKNAHCPVVVVNTV